MDETPQNPPTETTTLPFGDVLTAHEMAKSRSPFFAGMTLPDFSRYMNKVTNSKMYDMGTSGDVGRFVKQTETGLNETLAPVAKVTGDVGAGIGSLFGQTGEEIGRSAGESIPRSVATMLPYAAGVAALPISAPVGATLAGAGLLSAASEGYAKTGSVAAGAINAASLPFMGLLGHIGLKQVGLPVSTAVGDYVGKYLGSTATGLVEKGIEEVGRTAGEIGAMEAANQATSVVTGNGFYNPFSVKHAAEMIAGILPFKALDLPTFARGYKLEGGQVVPTTMAEMFSHIDNPVRSQAEGDRLTQAALAVHNSFTSDVAAQLKAKAVTQQRDPSPGQEELPGIPPAIPPVVKPMFLPKDLSDGFGSVASEQTNGTMEKPFGLKPTPTPDGAQLPGNSLLQKLPTFLPKEEWGILKEAGIENLLKDKRIGVSELNQWVKDNGPQVKVETYGMEGRVSEAQKEYADMVHRFDSLGVDPHDSTKPWTPEQQKDRQRMMELEKVIAAEPRDTSPRATSAYESVSALDTTQPMPEWTTSKSGRNVQRVDVVIPQKERVATDTIGADLRGWEKGRRDKEGKELEEPKWRQDNLHENLPNTLGWAMIQYKTGPKGEKIAVVAEAQSRWGQHQRKVEAQEKEKGRSVYAGRNDVTGHPLLRDYNRLILKAAINQAIKEGATHIVISDGETAMMTEGLDAHGLPRNLVNSNVGTPEERLTAAKINEGYIQQAKGMRLNYDTILPKIAEELTGSKGEKVSLGEHKNAFKITGTRRLDERTVENVKAPRSDLIFRNPDGTPKTDVSGVMYPLAKAHEQLLARGGYTLFGKDKVLSVINTLSKQAVPVEQLAESARRLENYPVKKGETIEDAAMREVGLNPDLNKPGSEKELFASTKAYFDRLGYLQGYDQNQIDHLTKNALAVVAKFAPSVGRTRVIKAVGDANFASAPRGGNWNGLVGLLRGVKGELGDLGRLWALGHELTHQIEFGVAGKDLSISAEQVQAYTDALNSAKLLSPEEKQQTITTMIQGLNGDKKVGDKMAAFRGEFYKDPTNGHAEFIADVSGLIAMGAKNPTGASHLADMAFFGNKETTGFIHSITKTLSAVYGMVKEYLLRMVGKKEASIVSDLYENTSKILASKDKADAALSAFLGWDSRTNRQFYDDPPVASYEQLQAYNRSVSGYDQSVVSAMWPFKDKEPFDHALGKDIEDAMGKRRFGGIRATSRQLWLPIQQFVKEIPIFKPAADLGHSLPSIAAEATQDLWAPFIDSTGKINTSLVTKVATKGGVFERAFSELALKQQDEDKVFTRAEREERSKSYAALNPGQKAEIDQLFKQFGDSSVRAAVRTVNGQRDGIAAGVATVLQNKIRTLDMDAAMSLGRDIVSMHYDKGNPEVDTQAAADRVTAAKLDPEVFLAASDVAVENLDGHLEFRKQMLGEDGKGKYQYFPEVRIHNWHIAWEGVDGVRHYEDYATEKEGQTQLDRLNRLKAQGQVAWIRDYNAQDKRAQYSGLQRGSLDAFAKAETRLLNSILARLDKGTVEYAQFAEELKEAYTPGEGSLMELSAPNSRQRQGVAGRENLNMAEGMVHYLDATCFGAAKRSIRQQQALALNSPGLRDNLNIRALAKRYFDSLLDTNAKEYTKLKNLIFLNCIGFNLSSNMMVFSHQALRHAPALVREGFGIGESFKAITSSFLTVGKARLNKGYADAETGKAVAQATLEKTIDSGTVRELLAEGDLSRINARNMITETGKVNTARTLAGNTLYHIMKAGQDFYGLATKFNAEAAFVSAFTLAKKRSLSYEAAYNLATSIVKVSTSGGGIANRPLALHGWGKLSGVGGLMYSMASYEAGAIAMQSRYLIESIKKSNMPAGEKLAARKAAGLMLAMQLTMGGVLGLPFVNSGMAIIDSLFPEAEVRKKTRKAFFDLGGNDEDLGRTISNSAMRGVFNSGPMGFGSRFEMGKLMGLDPDTAKWDLGEIFGPIASVADSYTKGVQNLGKGELGHAISDVAPAGIKGLLKMYLSGGNVTDSKDRMIFEPTAAEQSLIALGFKPRRLTDYYEEQQIKAQSERAMSDQLQEFHRDMGKRLVAGDIQGVHDALLERQQNTANYDVLEGVKRSVEAAQDQTIPVDPTRTGSRSNATSLSQIGQLFEKPNMPTEQERLMQRMALSQQIRIPGAGMPSMSEFKSAAMVDEVMKQNPSLGRVEALRIVQKIMNPKHDALAYGAQ